MWNKYCNNRDKKSSSQSRSVVPELVAQTHAITTLVFFLTHAIVVLSDAIYLKVAFDVTSLTCFKKNRQYMEIWKTISGLL